MQLCSCEGLCWSSLTPTPTGAPACRSLIPLIIWPHTPAVNCIRACTGRCDVGWSRALQRQGREAARKGAGEGGGDCVQTHLGLAWAGTFPGLVVTEGDTWRDDPDFFFTIRILCDLLCCCSCFGDGLGWWIQERWYASFVWDVKEAGNCSRPCPALRFNQWLRWLQGLHFDWCFRCHASP